MLNQYGNDQIRVDAKYELNDDPTHISLYFVAMMNMDLWTLIKS